MVAVINSTYCGDRVAMYTILSQAICLKLIYVASLRFLRRQNMLLIALLSFFRIKEKQTEISNNRRKHRINSGKSHESSHRRHHTTQTHGQHHTTQTHRRHRTTQTHRRHRTTQTPHSHSREQGPFPWVNPTGICWHITYHQKWHKNNRACPPPSIYANLNPQKVPINTKESIL